MISQIYFVIKTTGATLCTLKEVCLTEKKLNLPLYLIKHHVMKAYGGGEGGDLAPRILNLGCSSSPDRFTFAGSTPGVHWQEPGWVRNPVLWRNFNVIHTVQ